MKFAIALTTAVSVAQASEFSLFSQDSLFQSVGLDSFAGLQEEFGATESGGKNSDTDLLAVIGGGLGASAELDLMADEGSINEGMDEMDKSTELILDGLFDGVVQMSSADLEAELDTAAKANKFMALEETVKEDTPVFVENVVEEVIQAAPLVQEKLREAESVKAEQPKIEKKSSRPSISEATRRQINARNIGNRNPYARRNPYAARVAQPMQQQRLMVSKISIA